MLRVFLCHATEDKQPVRDLYRRLKRSQFKPWLDEEDLLPGQDWDQEIRKAVLQSEVILICLSRASVTKEGYVQREIKLALDAAEEKPDETIFVIPLRLEECDIPERLNRWQRVDLFADRGYSRLRKALGARAEQLGSEGTAASENTVPQATLEILPEEVCLYHVGVCFFELRYFSGARDLDTGEFRSELVLLRNEFEEKANRFLALCKRLNFPLPRNLSYETYNEEELKVHLTACLSLAPVRWKEAYGLGFDVGHAALGAIPLFLGFAEGKAGRTKEVNLMLKLGFDYIERAEGHWNRLSKGQNCDGLAKLKGIFERLKSPEDAPGIEEAVSTAMDAVREIGGELETSLTKNG